jgi:spore coat protein A, manganese oxidase
LSHFSRRSFVRSLLASAALTPGSPLASAESNSPHQNTEKMAHPPLLASEPQLNALALPAFADPLPLPEFVSPALGRLSVTMREVSVSLHRDLPPARLWMYAAGDGRHASLSGNPLPPVIELRKDHPAAIEWINLLPSRHLFAIDHSLHGCGRDIPDVRAVVHLHGARTRTRDDGYPDDWFVPGQARVCHYPLQQDAAALWYHDHAMGINRLNIYAGLAGLALIRDEQEEPLRLPEPPWEVPLILYDRMLTKAGQLLYPVSGIPEHPWVSEFQGDALCVNGKITPFLDVEPRLYRLRVLNAANSRFYALALSNRRAFRFIGSDQGLLAAPVSLDRLVLAPGERADLLIDFSDAAGEKIRLLTGVQPMLEFRVAPRASTPAALPPLPAQFRPIPRIPAASAVTTRRITLNEYQDKAQNPVVMLINRKAWHDPVTETVTLGATEIWEFINLTEDTHPMHLHLVRFQILDRRAFEPFDYLMQGNMHYTAEPELPAPQEMGWKDVVQCPGGMVTRIVVRFDGFPGRYLYHCHILEHEANDMMRPYDVVARAT